MITLTKETFDIFCMKNKIVVLAFLVRGNPISDGLEKIVQAQEDSSSNAKFAKVFTDEAADIFRNFGITAVPTLMIMKNQVIVYMQAGTVSSEVLQDILEITSKIKDEEIKKLRA